VRLLEAPLEDFARGRQLPERNGVVAGALGGYLDAARFPNVALAVLRAQTGHEAAVVDARKKILEAAENPNRDRVRYRLWDWFGPWFAYAHAAGTAPSPLTANVPLPSAAFVDYAYGAARIDLTPGATDANACPELVWQTLMHFYDRPLDGHARFWTYARRAAEGTIRRATLSGELAEARPTPAPAARPAPAAPPAPTAPKRVSFRAKAAPARKGAKRRKR
jgi:hypothetical protein